MSDTAPITSKAALEELARILGEDPSRIKQKRVDWMNYMKRGVVVTLHVRRWRAKTKLDLSELGLNADGAEEKKVFDELIELGYKRLLPSRIIDRLDAIESSARKTLRIHSTETKWGRFVADTAYQAWKEENSRFEADYWEALADILRDYDRIVFQLADEYRASARKAYRQLRATNPELLTGNLRWENSFVETYVQKILDLVPSRETIKASFGYDVEIEFIPLPSLLQEDIEQVEQSKIRTQKEREMSAIEIEMRRDVLQRAAEQKEELVNGFLRDLVTQLRGTVYSATTDVLDSVKRNGNLQPRSVVQLRGLIEQVGKLNFFGDTEIDKMVDSIQGILDKSPSDRKVEDITANLQSIATITKNTLLTLGESPRSKVASRELGIPEVPSLESVRHARKSLGLVNPGDIEQDGPRQARLTD